MQQRYIFLFLACPHCGNIEPHMSATLHYHEQNAACCRKCFKLYLVGGGIDYATLLAGCNPTELKVLKFIANHPGKSHRQIAASINVSLSTIKTRTLLKDWKLFTRNLVYYNAGYHLSHHLEHDKFSRTNPILTQVILCLLVNGMQKSIPMHTACVLTRRPISP